MALRDCTLGPAAFLLVILLAGGCVKGDDRLAEKVNLYLYGDTRKLVILVEDAARLMETEGARVFREFSRKGSRWLNGDDYLFVYDVEGNCVFHPMAPELVGRNLLGFRDVHGRKAIEQITAIGRLPQPDADGWVFYLWEEGTQLAPTWKSSYIRKVVAPDGKTYLVGSGSYNIKIEKVFVRHIVNGAVKMLERSGREAAFASFNDPASPFHIRDTYIFVLDSKGSTLVDPAYPTSTGRDMTGFTDAAGRKIVREMMEKLKKADEAWVQFLCPKPGSILPSRKLLYVRKVRVGGETLAVGSSFFLAAPVWMKQ